MVTPEQIRRIKSAARESKQAKTTISIHRLCVETLGYYPGPRLRKAVMDIVNQEGGLVRGRIPHSLVAVESKQLHAATDEKIKFQLSLSPEVVQKMRLAAIVQNTDVSDVVTSLVMREFGNLRIETGAK